MTISDDLIIDLGSGPADQQLIGFLPELTLGPAAFDNADGRVLAQRIAEQLHAVACRRNFALHTAVAFNVLHWGYDLDEGVYSVAAMDALDACRAFAGTVTPGANRPLPIGAFVEFTVGNAHTMFAELVAKDGRPVADGDSVELEHSGARSGPTLNEAWCLDVDALDRYERWAKKMRQWTTDGYLDAFGLVPVQVDYGTSAAANDPDTAYFVRWMTDHGAAVLADGPLGKSLVSAPDPTTDTGRALLAGALVATLEAIEAILAASALFRRWGDYWLPAEWVADVDDLPSMPLHAYDLRRVLNGIACAGAPDYGVAALAPRLNELTDSFTAATHRSGTNRQGPGDRDADDGPLSHTHWARTIPEASRWIADRLGETRGVVNVDGQLRSVHCDDQWVWGGTWLSTPVPEALSPQWTVPIDEPQWLGTLGPAELDELWFPSIEQGVPSDGEPGPVPADSSGGGDGTPDTDTPTSQDAHDHDAAHEHADDGVRDEGAPDDAGEVEGAYGADERDADEASAPAPEPAAAEPAAAPSEPQPEPVEDEPVSDTFVEAVITLRATDCDHSTIRLDDRFATFLDRARRGGAVHLQLHHDGLIDDDQRTQTLRSGPLADTLYGVSWPIDVGPGVQVHLTGVPGLPTLWAATRVDERDGQGRPTFVSEPEPHGRRRGRDINLRVLIIDALRRVGRASYGTRRATASQVTAALFGSNHPALLHCAVTAVLDELVGRSYLARAGSEYSLTDRLGDPVRPRITPAGTSTRAPERNEVRVHTVMGFLRRLPYGWRASQRQADLYWAAHRKPLPLGFTFVVEHHRGHETDAYIRALEGVRIDDETTLTRNDARTAVNQVFGRNR